MRSRTTCKDGMCCRHRLPHADEEADQRPPSTTVQTATPLGGAERCPRPLVMLVLGNGQGDEDVGVEQRPVHSSSKASATSCEVTALPRESTGSPVSSSRASSTGASTWASPRIVRSAMTADKDLPCCRASPWTRRYTAGGKLTVVRMPAQYRDHTRCSPLLAPRRGDERRRRSSIRGRATSANPAAASTAGTTAKIGRASCRGREA